MKYTFWSAIFQLHRAEQSFYQNRFLGLHLGGIDYGVLLFLRKRKGCRQEELGGRFSVDKATITKSLLRLEKAGCILREVDRVDRRQKLVSITPKGLTVGEEIKTAGAQWDETVLQGLGKKERERLLKLLLATAENAKRGIEDSAEQNPQPKGE